MFFLYLLVSASQLLHSKIHISKIIAVSSLFLHFVVIVYSTSSQRKHDITTSCKKKKQKTHTQQNITPKVEINSQAMWQGNFKRVVTHAVCSPYGTHLLVSA